MGFSDIQGRISVNETILSGFMKKQYENSEKFLQYLALGE